MGRSVKLQEVRTELLKPYERNAKIHPQDQIDKLVESIREFGFLTPCVIDAEYNVIAGHGRITAAEQMGLEKVPCVFVEGLTEEQRKAYVLADNKLGELAGWDFAMLNDELSDLEDFDMGRFGFESYDFDDSTIDSLFMDAPEKEEKPKRIECPYCGEWFEV